MNIIRKYKLWFLFSGTLIVLSLVTLVFNGMVRGKVMNFGIDFTGGTILNLRFTQPTNVGQVRGILDEYKLGEASIQKSGDNDFLIRLEPIEPEVRQKIVDEAGTKLGGVELLEADTIGPVIGSELRSQAIWAIILANGLILLYLSFRFEFIYALAGVLALIHDATITTGFMAFLYRNIDVTFVAGILTILGYSITDTVVIFDRIREDLRKPGAGKKPFADLVNQSIFSTLARSINTVLTVIIMVLSLLIFGGENTRDLCILLLIGFSFGCYSSIFIASPIVVLFSGRK
ncbi:MAG TPA: protein translocase subunit SecF [Candidatus Omnitrophota bacterium]|nr:protein translocase subunit SecF [Candidatus Omnitrophota bacterium]